MKRTEAYRQFIEDKLRERYPTFLLHGRTSFQAPDGTILRIDTLNWAQEALVVEYAYDETWVENNVFEDGDLFYLDELSPEEMLAGMLAEIEGTPAPTLPAEIKKPSPIPLGEGFFFYIRADMTIKIPFPTLILASSAAHWLLIPMGNVLVTTAWFSAYFPPVMHTSSQVSDTANTDRDHPSRRGRVMLPSVKK